MKKWIIGGMIVGAAWPILGMLLPDISIPVDLGWLALTLFPFGYFMMDVSLESTPHFFWPIFIIASILNIGLYTFLGFIVGAIVQIGQEIRKNLKRNNRWLGCLPQR